MSINERIRSLRKEKGWTRKQLSEISKVPETTIRNYENDEKRQPRIEQLQKLADTFNVSTDWLLTGKEDIIMPPANMHASTGGGASGTTDIALAKQRMNADFDTLNPSGKREAAKRVHELTLIPEYKE